MELNFYLPTSPDFVGFFSTINFSRRWMMVELRTLAFHEAWQAGFFTGDFRVFLRCWFFFRVQTNFWPVCGVRLVGCKGTTWKFAVIWNSPTCWTPRPQQSQHLRAAAAHQASIVPVLRASRIVDLQKNFNGKKPAVVAGDMLWSNVLFTF